MLPFSSIDFLLVFCLPVLALYVIKKTGRWIAFDNVILIFSLSYILILYPSPLKLLVFILSTYLLYLFLVQRWNPRHKIFGCIILLLPLILMKANIKFHFYPFSLNEVIVFAGLSYISFRVIHLYMDSSVSKKTINFKDWGNFLLFAPTLLIGPIDRYARFKSDLNKGYDAINSSNLEKGFELIAIGILQKYVLAEFVARYWLNPIGDVTQSYLTVANGMYAYYFYLYFDFAGYSSMAIGLAKTMGFDVPFNFNLPFLAHNIQDFWRRFHKTLGDFLNDYFFKPIYMFLTRKSSWKNYPLLRQNTALFLTFLLMGTWNGFDLHFLSSGALFGLYSVIHNTYTTTCKKKGRDVFFGKLNPGLVKVLSILITFHLTAISLLIFSGKLL